MLLFGLCQGVIGVFAGRLVAAGQICSCPAARLGSFTLRAVLSDNCHGYKGWQVGVAAVWAVWLRAMAGPALRLPPFSLSRGHAHGADGARLRMNSERCEMQAYEYE